MSMSMTMPIVIFSLAEIAKLYRVHEVAYGENKNVIIKYGEGFTEKKCLEPLMENQCTV